MPDAVIEIDAGSALPQPGIVIIGAGPAGLTAALELTRRSDLVPLVLEATDRIGGISTTIEYKGNRIDIGGHRFFSKSDEVMDWWAGILPIEAGHAGQFEITYQNRTRTVVDSGTGPDPSEADDVMLVRERLSRIYYLRRFFDYPVKINLTTVRNLGVVRIVRILMSYLAARIRPIKTERSLEDFMINRFGRELYGTFFRDYTEKVWGVPCDQISAEWGAQRIKGLSITKTLVSAIKSALPSRKGSSDIRQKAVETSLIERFLYPKLGPGQMWDRVAEMVEASGGTVVRQRKVERIVVDGDARRVVGVEARDMVTGAVERLDADYVISTMPVKDLVSAFDVEVPAEVQRVAQGLLYRDFITVGLLLDKLVVPADPELAGGLIADNWIYIQESDVQVGRLQIFNNWSPFMVADPSKVWLGLEYFVNEGGELWEMDDDDLVAFAASELEKIEIIDAADVLDATVIRVPKTYPAYFGTYDEFDRVREYLDRFDNLFLVGRNGMHRYNNQDHSMLTAIEAVKNILSGRTDKENIWSVNVEQEYHEEKAS